MSEYQYHHFRRIDRPLTAAERKEVEGLSSHAMVTANTLTIEYHWGDFKHDPLQVVTKYFDAYFYFSNWGTQRLILRLPKQLLDEALLKPYLEWPREEYAEYHLRLNSIGDDYLFDLYINPEEGGSEWMNQPPEDLFALRENILTGDDRPLFLAWLISLDGDFFAYEQGELDTELLERRIPAIPSGLEKLTAPQASLTDFFGLPESWLLAAREFRPERAATKPPSPDVSRLSEAELGRRRLAPPSPHTTGHTPYVPRRFPLTFTGQFCV